MKINYGILAIMIIVAGLVLGFYLYEKDSKKSLPTIETPKEIETDSIKRDSIKEINDKIETEIGNINDKYNEEVSNVMSNTDSANFVFFAKYIEDYNNKRTAANY